MLLKAQQSVIEAACSAVFGQHLCSTGFCASVLLDGNQSAIAVMLCTSI